MKIDFNQLKEDAVLGLKVLTALLLSLLVVVLACIGFLSLVMEEVSQDVPFYIEIPGKIVLFGIYLYVASLGFRDAIKWLADRYVEGAED